MNFDRMIAAARLETAEAGCNCDPDYDVLEVAPNVYVVRIAHDSWCLVLNPGSQN